MNNNFYSCAGRPGIPCPFKRQDRSVKFSVSDLFLCSDCDDYRNPPRRAMSDNTVKTVNTDTVPTVAKHGVVSATPPSVTNVTTKSLKDSVVISEVLCFVIASFHRCAHKQIKASLLDIYSAEEICDAKHLIHSAASSISDSVPRLIKRKKNSDNRLKQEIDDLFQLLVAVDEKLLMKSLPTYVIADPFRVPSLDVEDNDSRVLSLKVNELEKKLDQLLIILQNNMVQVPSPMIPQHTLPQNPVMEQPTFAQTKSCVSTANILKDQTVTLPRLPVISEFNVDCQTMVMSDFNSGVIVESEPSIATTIQPSILLDTTQVLESSVLTTSQSDTTESVVLMPSPSLPEMPVMFDCNSHVIVESEPSIAAMIHPSTILDTTQILESSVLTTSQTDTTESDVSVPLSNIPASEDAGNSTEIPWNDVVKRRSPMKIKEAIGLSKGIDDEGESR